jgi:hypothetical protein
VVGGITTNPMAKGPRFRRGPFALEVRIVLLRHRGFVRHRRYCDTTRATDLRIARLENEGQLSTELAGGRGKKEHSHVTSNTMRTSCGGHDRHTFDAGRLGSLADESVGARRFSQMLQSYHRAGVKR